MGFFMYGKFSDSTGTKNFGALKKITIIKYSIDIKDTVSCLNSRQNGYMYNLEERQEKIDSN